MHNDDCIFCKIARGAAPCDVVLESKEYMAFLSIFPNTLGTTVVITKDHYPSDYSKLPRGVRFNLTEFAVRAMNRLTDFFPDVERTGLVWEGYGVNHIHAKLFPLHGTKAESGEWVPIVSREEDRKYYDIYQGYIASHSGPPADPEELAQLARQIRGE